MKDAKVLQEFKRIKNLQKAKRGAMIWSSLLAVALAIFFAFPVDEGFIVYRIQLGVLALLFVITGMWVFVFIFEPGSDSASKPLTEQELKLLGLNGHIHALRYSSTSVDNQGRQLDSDAPVIRSSLSASTPPQRTKLISPSRGYSGSRVINSTSSPYADPSLYDENCAKDRMHLSCYESPSSKRQSNGHGILSPASKVINSPYRSGVGGQLTPQQSRYHVSPAQSLARYEHAIMGVPLSPGDSRTGGTYSIKDSSNVPVRVLKDVTALLPVSNDDKCIANLRRALAVHLQERMQRFETVVAAIVQQLDTSGMCGRKQAMSVLEHTDDARSSFHISGLHHHRFSYTVEDFMGFANSDTMALRQPHPQYGGTLLENLMEYQTILTMFYLPQGDGRSEAGISPSIGYAIKRCKELVHDGRLGKFSWDDHGGSGAASSAEGYVFDAEIIVAIFLNYCDWRSVWGGRDASRSFSGIHFQVDLAKSSGPHGPVNARASRFASPSRLHHSHSRVVLVQRAASNPHFNIYVDSETPPIELAVPLGRQNCFLAIIYFLLAIEKYDYRGGTRGHTGRTSSLPSALRDLFVDIFGEGDGGDI